MRSNHEDVASFQLFDELDARQVEWSSERLVYSERAGHQEGVFEGHFLQEVVSALVRSKRTGRSPHAECIRAIDQRMPVELPRGLSDLSDRSSAEIASLAPPLLKSMFDFYFREDLYGDRRTRPIILSSGSFDESVFGLPASLKQCLKHSIDVNWYGYSDSLGRISAREALAKLEASLPGGRWPITSENVAVTMGGTATIASLVDLVASEGKSRPRAVAAVPNYPPLVAAMARRLHTVLAPTPLVDGGVDVSGLIAAIDAETRFVLVQTVINPWGKRLPEAAITQIVEALPPHCMLVLDECHDAFGPVVPLTAARNDERVVSIRSMSKRWAAPGIKAGWLVAQPALVSRFYHHASTTYGGPPSLLYLMLEFFAIFEASYLTGEDVSQEAARLELAYGLNRGTLLRGYGNYVEHAQTMDREVVSRRTLVVERLTEAGIPVLAPEYSINLVAHLGNQPSYGIYRDLVSEAGVSVLPGMLTMGDSVGVVRISPCLDENTLDEGLSRIVNWVQTVGERSGGGSL